jgi:hypothetical protein
MPKASNLKGPDQSWRSVETSEFDINSHDEPTFKGPALKVRKSRSKRTSILVGIAISIVVGMVTILLIKSSIF